MDQIYPDEGLITLQKIGLTADIEFGLFTNNLTPGLATTWSAITEASWMGYARQTLHLADWNFSFVTAHIATVESADIAFTNSSGSPVTAYGFFAKPVGTNQLLWIARFDGAPVTIGPGASYPVSPVVGGYSALSS